MNPDTNMFEKLSQQVEPSTVEFEKLNQHLGFGTVPSEFAKQQLLRSDGSPVPEHWSTFEVGEQVVIKNYTFEVKYIGETSILFEPIGVVEIEGVR